VDTLVKEVALNADRHVVDENMLDWRMPDFYWRWLGGGPHISLHAYRVEFFEKASQIPNGLWDAWFQPPAEGCWWYETLDQSGIEDQFTWITAARRNGCSFSGYGKPLST